MSSEKFKYYDHLGFHNPHYIKHDNGTFSYDFNGFLLTKDRKRKFDYLAFAENLSYGYCLGDRTLIQGLNRTPWMARPNTQNNDWEYKKKVIHQELVFTQEQVANKFYQLLEKELLDYITPYENIGILLTGGMDSRIVAAIIKNLFSKGLIENKRIKAFTWGLSDSRDVVYANRIADLYGWEFCHLINDEEQMRKNIEVCIQHGCEFHPVHLHAMSQLKDQKDIDCYIAGSFGDSIGRAEFSGKHILDVHSLKSKFVNINALFHQETIDKDKLDADFNYYRNNFKQDKSYQDNEIDLQAHYMRRMLNPCMATINESVPLFQMFSAPETFLYMWSIHPNLRNNENYFIILKKYAPELLDIPWARTGLPYLAQKGTPDTFKKNHHEYGKLIRKHFLEQYILPMVIDNKEIADKIINTKAFIKLCNNVKKYPLNHQYLIEARLLYVACVIDMIIRNHIEIDLPLKPKTSFISIFKNDLEYKLKFIAKKIM